MEPGSYHKDQRCGVCRLPGPLCVCSELTSVAVPFELLVIQHRTEKKSVSNTGSLAARVLQPSRLLDYQGTSTPEIEKALEGDGPRLLLYPQSRAEPLTPEHLAPGTRLIVLDATWRQARRMYRKLGPLRGCTPVTLPDGVEPRWVLRAQPAPGMLGTAEAIAAATDALGCADAALGLRAALDFVLPRALHTLAKISLEQALDPDFRGCTPDKPPYPSTRGKQTEE